MTNKTLNSAIDCVKREEEYLQEDIEAFKTFREIVSRTSTADSTEGHTEMENLSEVYRKVVFERLDYEETYGESYQECLVRELTPSLANALVNNQPLTHRRKRNLLVATNEAINRRSIFSDSLERERESLQMVQEGLLQIEEKIHELPAYSLQHLQLEEVVNIWEDCERLVKQCDQLAKTRQRCFRNRQTLVGETLDTHTLNTYLYANLETEFPALLSLIEMHEYIEQYRGESKRQSESDLDCRFGRSIATESLN